MTNSPNYLRLTPDTKKRSVSGPSRTLPKITNVEAETDDVLHLSAEMEAYMKIKEESVAVQVEERVQKALAEITKHHEEVEKRYLDKIKNLEDMVEQYMNIVEAMLPKPTDNAA